MKRRRRVPCGVSPLASEENHFHRDHRYPGGHSSKQSESGIFVELCPCWWSGKGPLVLRRVPGCGLVTDILARSTTKLALADSSFYSPNIQLSTPKVSSFEGSDCGACELRSNSSERQRAVKSTGRSRVLHDPRLRVCRKLGAACTERSTASDAGEYLRSRTQSRRAGHGALSLASVASIRFF